MTVTTGLVDANSTPTLLRLVAARQIEPSQFVSHHFDLAAMLDAYDVFSRASETGAAESPLVPLRIPRRHDPPGVTIPPTSRSPRRHGGATRGVAQRLRLTPFQSVGRRQRCLGQSALRFVTRHNHQWDHGMLGQLQTGTTQQHSTVGSGPARSDHHQIGIDGGTCRPGKH